MKTKGKVSDYVKSNRRGSREAEFEISVGWTAKTKVHKNKKQYDRKSQNLKSDSDFFILYYIKKNINKKIVHSNKIH
jgi:hypothetical protein